MKRFWEKVERTEGCWHWKANPSQRYGLFKLNGKMIHAHRLSYTFANGPIPDGMYVCHTCDNARCVNPDHLFLGSPSDNAKDMWRKGRASFNAKPMRGEKNGRAKLTAEQASEIRHRLSQGEQGKSLAKEYEISESVVSLIKRRKIWE